MTTICVQCNQSFPTLEKLEDHEKSGHTIKGTPLTNNPIDPQFAATLKDIQEAEKAKKVTKNIAPDGTELKLPEPKPIQLTYKFIGVDSCGHEVVTLEMDINNRHFVTAFCLQENKQIESREVANLENKKNMPNMPEENLILPKQTKTK